MEAKLSQFTVKERALIYLRNSGDARRSALGKTQENQEHKCLLHVENNGYHLVDVLAEDPNAFTSGADSDLPEYQKMLQMAERGLFDVLVSRDVERVARDEPKFYELKKQLDIYGVRIELYNLPSFGTKGNEFKDAIDVAYAAEDKRRLVQKLVTGQKDVVRNGRILKSDSPPYGYDFAFYNGINDRDGWKLVTVDSQAEIVILIFQLCLEGYGVQAIANHLNKAGYPTPKGEILRKRNRPRREQVRALLATGLTEKEIAKQLKKSIKTIQKDIRVLNGEKDKWHQSTVLHILKNRTYTGIWEYNKMGRVKVYDREQGKVVKKWTKHSKDEIESTDCPVIIDEEIYNAVQEKLVSNRKLAKRNTKREYLMSGRLRCECGTAVLVHSVPGYYYYKCDARRRPKRHAHTCDLPTFTVKEVDTLVWDKLGEYIKNPEKLREGMLEYQQETSQIVKPLEKRLKIIDLTIQDKELEFDDALNNMRLVKSDKAKLTFANEADTIEKIIDGLKAERQDILSKIETESVTDEQINTSVEFAIQMAKDWDTISKNFPSKRDFVDLLNVQVILMCVDGKRKGLLTAKLGKKPIDLCFDDNAKLCIVYNNKIESFTFKTIIDFD